MTAIALCADCEHDHIYKDGLRYAECDGCHCRWFSEYPTTTKAVRAEVARLTRERDAAIERAETAEWRAEQLQMAGDTINGYLKVSRRERDAAMEALKRIKAMSAVAGYDFGDVTIHNVARQIITAIETGAIHDQR